MWKIKWGNKYYNNKAFNILPITYWSSINKASGNSTCYYSCHVKTNKRWWENVGQNSFFNQLWKVSSIISPTKVTYHSAFSLHGALIKNDMEIQYINVHIFSQTLGVSTLSKITLFLLLYFLIKYYPSH